MNLKVKSYVFDNNVIYIKAEESTRQKEKCANTIVNLYAILNLMKKETDYYWIV